MKVVNAKQPPPTKFTDIPIGGVFESQGYAFIKTQPFNVAGVGFNAIYASGEHIHFTSTQEVVARPRAELHLEP